MTISRATLSMQTRVVEYMMAHPNAPLSIDTIMDAVGADRKMQIQNVIGYLRRERPELGHHIRVIIAGNMYEWATDGDPKYSNHTKRLFEELATTLDGTILVQDEDGRPYRLVEI